MSSFSEMQLAEIQSLIDAKVTEVNEKMSQEHVHVAGELASARAESAEKVAACQKMLEELQESVRIGFESSDSALTTGIQAAKEEAKLRSKESAEVMGRLGDSVDGLLRQVNDLHPGELDERLVALEELTSILTRNLAHSQKVLRDLRDQTPPPDGWAAAADAKFGTARGSAAAKAKASEIYEDVSDELQASEGVGGVGGASSGRPEFHDISSPGNKNDRRGATGCRRAPRIRNSRITFGSARV